ncbi:hypothetical protein [Paraburkholderia jirisanensis]
MLQKPAFECFDVEDRGKGAIGFQVGIALGCEVGASDRVSTPRLPRAERMICHLIARRCVLKPRRRI